MEERKRCTEIVRHPRIKFLKGSIGIIPEKNAAPAGVCVPLKRQSPVAGALKIGSVGVRTGLMRKETFLREPRNPGGGGVLALAAFSAPRVMPRSAVDVQKSTEPRSGQSNIGIVVMPRML